MKEKSIPKLFQYLNTFSKEERRVFLFYLKQQDEKSPLKSVLKLYEAVLDHYDFNPKKIPTKETLFKIVEGNIPYKDAKMRSWMSKLTKLIETFWAAQELEQNVNVQQQLLLSAMEKRALDQHRIRYLKNHQPSHEIESPTTYYYEFEWLARKYEVERGGQNRSTKDSLEELNKALDVYYFTNKLKYYSMSMNTRQILKVEYELQFVDKLWELIQVHPEFMEHPLLDLYSNVIHLINKPKEEQYYDRLKELLMNDNRYAIDIKSSICTMCINYANRQLKSGRPEFMSEMFEWYKLLLRDEILTQTGEISPHHYKNICTIALSLDAFSWVKSFIEKYRLLLDETYREGIYCYNLANLFFHEQKYEEARTKLLSVEFVDFFYKLDFEKLLMKIYYDLNEWMPLQSLMESNRIYLLRLKSLSAANKAGYENFVKLLASLHRIKMGGRKKPAKLLDQIIQCDLLRDREWLLEKTKALIE